MSKTPYQIEYTDKGSYLYAAVSGEQDSLEVSIAYWTEVLGELKARHKNKLLVTEDFKDAVSAIDMYTLVEELYKFGVTDLKIAFVDKELIQFNLNKFGETVAVNRGIYAKVFNEEKEAEKWLLSNN